MSSNQYAKYSGSGGGGGGGGGSPTIGGPVVGGTDTAILFVHPSAILAQDATNLSFDATTHALTLGGNFLPAVSSIVNLGSTALVWNRLYVNEYRDPGNTIIIDSAHKLYNAAGTVVLDFSSTFLSANSHKISDVVNPVLPQDVATKNYVDTNFPNLTLSAVGSTPNANAASLSGQALNLQPFNSTNPGVVTASGGGTTNFLRADGTWAPAGTGTVTAVSVASANGFAGSSSGGSTPALTLSTTITGILKGDGTAISAAIAGDFPTLNQNTTGSAATLTTPRNINGVAFNGSADITVTSAAGTLTGTTLNSTVVTSSLTSIGAQAAALNMNSHRINNVTDPSAAQDAATKAYVDNIAAGINPAVAVQAATTAASDTSGYTYNNGVGGIGATLIANATNTALTVDGFTFTILGQRLLVKNDTQSPSGAFNGVYYVTQLQTAILPVILTRALDYDMPSDMNNTGAIPVINGTTNGTTQWVLTSLITTVGTDPLTFTRFARNPADYLLKTNNLSDVSSASTAFANITQPASAVLQGSVSTSAQTFAGEKTFNNALIGAQIATPANPSAGTDKLYFKADNNLYSLDSSGNERLVGPGMVGSDWVDESANFTPSAGFGTPTNLSVFTRRVGDTKEVVGQFTMGTTAGSSAYILLPVSAQMNAAKMPANVMGNGLGFFYGLDTPGPSDIIGNNGLADIIYFDGSATDRVFISRNSQSSAIKSMNVNGAYTSGSGVTFSFSYPVAGWSANNGPGRSGFQFYASSQVTTNSSTVTSSTFVTFDNSPAFTFTPTFTGTYKVYSNISLLASAGAQPVCRVFNTSGGATLLYESQAQVAISTGYGATLPVQSVYTLTAGVSYVFDLQVKMISGNSLTDGADAPFYMFAELCG